MVADVLRSGKDEFSEDELVKILNALSKQFKSEPKDTKSDKSTEPGKKNKSKSEDKDPGVTGQLVYFPKQFAMRTAEHIVEIRNNQKKVYEEFLTPPKAKDKKKNSEENDTVKEQSQEAGGEEKAQDKKSKELKSFLEKITTASKEFTVDVGLFGRMTTSDLVVNVDAACQVAHAIGTHDAFIESDWFTAMDDLKHEYVDGQVAKSGASYIGSGEQENFFCSSVFYKYFNVDMQALNDNVSTLTTAELAHAISVFAGVASNSHPGSERVQLNGKHPSSGRQTSMANPSAPELILVEISSVRRPQSYANAFLQPVKGGLEKNFMTESAKALVWYVDEIAPAFAPSDTKRLLLAVGHAKVDLTTSRELVASHEDLVKRIEALLSSKATD
jgi:hypothetical protein